MSGRWVSLGDSVTGTAHAARGIPCQDAFRIRTRGEWLLIAAADGAGSAARSDIGAEVACDEFVRLFDAGDPAALCDPVALGHLFAAAREAVCARGEALGVRPRELACTALVALVGPGAAAFAQVGDGAVVTGGPGGYRTVFWPEPAEYANATDFLTDDGFAAALRAEVADEPPPEVAVFTDGLQRLALDFAARAPHAGFFDPLFRALRDAADPEPLSEPFRRFLGSDRVNARTDDDKTLVLAARRP